MEKKMAKNQKEDFGAKKHENDQKNARNDKAR
jgi:hypothetical protein